MSRLSDSDDIFEELRFMSALPTIDHDNGGGEERTLQLGALPSAPPTSDHDIVRDEEWTKQFSSALQLQDHWIINFLHGGQRSPSVVSIFKVPDFLKDSIKREAYVPKVVSLGPYHHAQPSAELSPMDNHKRRAFHRMMIRYYFNHPYYEIQVNNVMEFPMSKMMETYDHTAMSEICNLEKEIRNSYEENMYWSNGKLARMLLLDGCFILEILRTLGGHKFPMAFVDEYYEPIFEKNRIDSTGFHMLNDILKLENQIPWIVLRKLLQLELKVKDDDAEQKLFEVMVTSASPKLYPFKYNISKWSGSQPDHQVPHLLGLLHRLTLSPPSDHGEPDQSVYTENDLRRIPPASELRNAGIKFEKCEGCIKNIHFDPKRGTIYLPPINITAHTEVLFRNLIALEACKASAIKYVTCYLSLMDELIDTEEDAALLRRSDIVTNYLGSDAEVAELFNGLCKGVTLSQKDYFNQLKQKVDVYYRKKIKVWLAEFVRDHGSSPWACLALTGAIVVLVLAAVQAVFSIFSVYKPK